MEAALKKKYFNNISPKTKAVVVDIIVYAFIALFIYTSVDKIYKFENFKGVLSNSKLIGPIGPLVAFFVPASELLIAVLLLLPATKRNGLFAATTLMTVFTIYVIIMMITGELICSCGGFIKGMSWPVHLVFNSIFILLGLVALSLSRKTKN